MEVFHSIDLAVFYLFNHTISTGFLDKFFSTITDVNNWYIAYIILIGILFFKGGRTGKLAVLGIIVLIIVTDQTCYKILKEIFQRPRPCNVLTDVLVPLGCRGSFSFPSNHAINNFAAAAFFSRLYPKYKIILFTTATLVSISRIYLGLHYPSDILGGAVIGMIFGYIFSAGIMKLDKYYEGKQKS